MHQINLLFGIGFTEILILVGAVLLLFGAKKIPQLARGIGSGIHEFKSGLKENGDGDPKEGSE